MDGYIHILTSRVWQREKDWGKERDRETEREKARKKMERERAWREIMASK